MTAEKIRIYKELDSMTSDEGIEKMKSQRSDRFGPLPPELESLMEIVRIRHLGEKLGFEKIIIKNGIMIAFFISNPLSQYYKSKVFQRVLEKLNENQKLFDLKQNNDKLRVVSRNVPDLFEASSRLSIYRPKVGDEGSLASFEIKLT